MVRVNLTLTQEELDDVQMLAEKSLRSVNNTIRLLLKAQIDIEKREAARKWEDAQRKQGQQGQQQ